MTNNINDWEYGEAFYNDDTKKAVRSLEEIAAECEAAQPKSEVTENADKSRLEEVADMVGQIKSLSAQGRDVKTIANELGYDESFVSDVLITISGSPEDDSDMAIAYLLVMG